MKNGRRVLSAFSTTCLRTKGTALVTLSTRTNLSWVDFILVPVRKRANNFGDNTKEPRFACNVQVSSQAEAFTVLQDFASIFRGMMYWQSNTIQVTADHGNLDGSAR